MCTHNYDTYSVNIQISGMCESCVAPLLILLISMFYKKDEQVSTQDCVGASFSEVMLVASGNPYIVVLRHGKLDDSSMRLRC